jgi:hypothetical protein
MRIRLFLPVLTFAALLGFSASGVRAGSFLGPSCYGADYTYQYPNRSHNLFGCGPGSRCQAWHPFFRHRWSRRNQGAPVEGMPANAMPGYGMPPVNGMPMEDMPAPTVQSRSVPEPASMQSGSVTAKPLSVDQSGKPPF